jgi:hypothetical protein
VEAAKGARVKPHESAFLPGEPPVLWSPHLASPSENPWMPGLAVWSRSHEVWYSLKPDEALWAKVPYDTVWLTPEHMPDGAADLAARVDTLEQIIRERFPRSP